MPATSIPETSESRNEKCNRIPPRFTIALHEYEDSVARWCVCSDIFWEFYGECCEVSGLTPQCAEVSEVDDCGEPEVNSPA